MNTRERRHFLFALYCALILAARLAGAEASLDSHDSLKAQAAKLLARGKFSEALNLQQQAYEGACAKAGDVQGADVADAAYDLASTYMALDRYEDARPYLMRALAIDNRLFGPHSPETATHIHLLGKLLIATGCLPEASVILLDARTVLERAYGPEAASLAFVFNELGLLSDKLGKSAEAATAYRQAILNYEMHGLKNQAAMVRINLVWTLCDLKRFDQAEQVARASRLTIEQLYGHDHPWMARALTANALVLHFEGRLDEARPLYGEAIEIWDRSPGADELAAATAKASLGGLYTTTGYYERAELLLKAALAIRERILGSANVELAPVLSNLGTLYSAQGRLYMARQSLERALAIANNARSNSPLVETYLENLATVYFRERDDGKAFVPKADSLYRQALELRQKRNAPMDMDAARILRNLADVCTLEKNFYDAAEFERRALAILLNDQGADDPDTRLAAKRYAALRRKSHHGDSLVANPLLTRVPPGSADMPR